MLLRVDCCVTLLRVENLLKVYSVMDALRNYLTPNAKKKQRVEEPFADDASIASEELEEEDDEEPPKWAQQQLKEMGEIKQMLSGLAGLQSDVKDIRTELNHV